MRISNNAYKFSLKTKQHYNTLHRVLATVFQIASVYSVRLCDLQFPDLFCRGHGFPISGHMAGVVEVALRLSKENLNEGKGDAMHEPGQICRYSNWAVQFPAGAKIFSLPKSTDGFRDLLPFGF